MNDARGVTGKVSNLFKQLAADRIALLCMIIVGIYLIAAVSVEIYSWSCSHSGIQPVYNIGNINLRYQPPSARHLFGTDFMGRDVLLRAVAGISTAVKVGFTASLISAFIGVTLGAVAGYFGGKFDDFVVWLYSTFASMPTLLFILAFALLVSKGFLSPSLAKLFAGFAALFNADPGMMAVYLAIGITGWVTLCRVVRAETLKLRETSYVQAAKVTGSNSVSIIIRHILPNLFHLVIIYFTIRFAFAIMTEVIVSYLGFGVQLSPSWGVMISQGQDGIWRGIWWEVAAATIFMFFLVLPLHLLGDALRDTLDPRLRQ
ncbi:ABC transporter permease [Lentisphaerota bacterium ZTH]|nr:ABC transporter permease [Lentisphaerota bacterium]WET05312.1 ABC transporter permease [Lentisphaerota bacterium ZTH]